MDDNTLKAIECIAAAIGVPFTVWAMLGGLAKTWVPDQYKVKMRTSNYIRASEDYPPSQSQPMWVTSTTTEPTEDDTDEDKCDEDCKGA